eukprot:gene16596-18285_t
MESDNMWETKTVIIEKTVPNKGFGIAISGGRDNPHFKTGSTAIIVSDIVPGSPSDGLLKVNDQVLFVNNANMNRASHAEAVMALKEAGSQARMVIRRMEIPPSARPVGNQAAQPQGSSTPKDTTRGPQTHQEPQKINAQETSKPTQQQQQQPKVELNGTTEKSLDDVQDDKIRITLDRGTRGYGFAMGQLFYIRELAPNGPALQSQKISPGDRVIEINSKPLDKVKTLNEAIDLVLNSTNQISLLIEKNAVKPLPAPRTPKIKKKISPVPVQEPEKIEAVQAAPEVQAEPPPAANEMEKSWKSPSTEAAAVAAKQRVDVDGPNVTKDSWDAASPAEVKPAPVEAMVQSNVIDAYTSKWERKRMDEIKTRRLSVGHEGHYINFQKKGNLGIQVAGGNEVGIFTAAVKGKSAAAKQGLKTGDLILEANEIDFRNITREEAVLILLALGEEVSLFVIPKKDEFEKIKTKLGDNFFVRANFDHHEKASQNELIFKKGEVFNIMDTMYQGLIGAWQAKRVGKNGKLLDQGILPNKSRAEQLAIAQTIEERQLPKNLGSKLAKLTRRGSVGGSLRRSKFKFTSQDKLDEQSFTEVNFQIPAYERVVLRIAEFMRPVVIIGPVADLARMLLIDEMPDRFGTPMNADAFGMKSRTLPRTGTYDKSYGDSVKLSNIRQVIQENKHCLLDLTPEGIEKLMFFQMTPIVILLKSYSKTLAREMRVSLVNQLRNSPTGAIDIDDDPLTSRQVKKIYSMTKKLEEFCPHIFTAKLNTHIAKTTANSREWYGKLKEIIFRQQSEMTWMPEEKPDEALMEDADLHRPNYLSYVSGGESDTDGESIFSEPKHFEDFEDSHAESPPRSPAILPPYRQRGDEDEGVFRADAHEPPQQQQQREPERAEVNMYDTPYDEGKQQFVDRTYDTPYEEERRVVEQRTTVTEIVTVEHRAGVQSSVHVDDDVNDDDVPAGYTRGEKPEVEPDVPVLRDPNYKLPSGFETEDPKPEEKKPFNAIRVFPNQPAKDARPSLRKADVPKPEEPVDNEYESEFKKKSESLKRVPKETNPVLKDMDERADVKVSELWQLENEIKQAPSPVRPPAPRNYVVDVSRDGRNRGQMVANSTYRPVSGRAEMKRLSEPPTQQNKRVVEERASAVYTQKTEAAPNGYPDEYDNAPEQRQAYRPPPPRESRPAFVERDREPASSRYRTPPSYENYTSRKTEVNEDRYSVDRRPAAEPRSQEPPNSYRREPYQDRNEPRYNRDQPYRDYSSGPVKPHNYERDRQQPTQLKTDTYDEPKVIATARGIFDYRGGLLESTETGVSVYIPAGALPEGKKQEIYFKVCQDNKYMPPLDSEGGETLLSPLVMCGPHGLKFKKPIELRLPHKGNSNEGMSFSLKSSESPVGDPSKWKNVQLGGKDLDASRAYQVSDDTVSVLVDHF